MGVGVGILGFAHGHVGAYCARWSADETLGVRVTAGWDHDAGRLARAAERHELAACESPEALLAREDVAAVVVAAETALHADLIVQAAEAGKAVICQKPLALTLDQADAVVAAVERTGTAFTMAWQMRVDPHNLEMKALLDSGRFGKVFMVRRRHGLSTQLMANFEASWHVDATMNRDIWADDAAHPIDFIYWLCGMPLSVTAELGTLANPRIVNDNGIATFRYADGAFAEVSCTFAAVGGECSAEIVCEKGIIIQNYGDGPSTSVPRPAGAISLKWYHQDDAQWTVSQLLDTPNQGHRIAALAGPLGEFLTGARKPIATAVEGRDVLRLVLACYESAEHGKRILLH